MGILKLTPDFDFSNLVLSAPRSTQGGSYVTRIGLQGDLTRDILIQMPPCKMKQGIVTNARRSYSDLMYDSYDCIVMEWIEKLEEKCREMIYKKSNDWFHNPLSEDDIESAFTSVTRLYNSGKNYLVRTLLKQSPKDASNEIVYNQRGELLSNDEVTSGIEIIPLVKIDCIRFSSRSFTMEVLLNQVMVLDNTSEIKGCVIDPLSHTESKSSKTPMNTTSEIHIPSSEDSISDKPLLDKEEADKTSESSEEEIIEATSATEESVINVQTAGTNNTDDIEESKEDKKAELKEVNLDIEDIALDSFDVEDDEKISLRKPSEVYHELYKVALEKAKQAKQVAVQAYLEAKRIRHTYLIDEMDSSDEDQYFTEE